MEYTKEVTTNDNQGMQGNVISPSMTPANSVSNGGTKAQYNWVDITKEFQTSVQDLELGELLHDTVWSF